MNKKTLIFLIISNFLFACNSFLTKAYGLKEITHIDNEKYRQFITKQKIDSYENLFLNIEMLIRADTLIKNDTLKKLFYQPLQVIYIKNGRIISAHYNCNAPGFPLLNWNRKGRFNLYPPKSSTDTVALNKNDLIAAYKSIYGNLLSKDSTNIILYWNFLMEKQSINLIHQVLNNAGESNERKKFIFVNNDSVFLKSK